MAAEFIGRSWLAELGYKDICTNPMAEQVETWWGWYTATNDFYAKDTYASGRHFKVRRITTRPAEMVCEDMASFLFNERPAIGITGEDEPGLTEASDWLKQWVGSVNLVRGRQPLRRAHDGAGPQEHGRSVSPTSTRTAAPIPTPASRCPASMPATSRLWTTTRTAAQPACSAPCR